VVDSAVSGWRALAEEGPAYSTLRSVGAVDWDDWRRAADTLEARLPPGPTRDRRIHHLYVPSLLWVLAQTARFGCALRVVGSPAARPQGRPLVVGLCAPQGSGKTTLMRELVPLLEARGLRAVSMSIDDFYLPRDAQVALARAHPGNRYLEHRGAPGTHDVALGEATLERLERLGSGETTKLPAYDKTANGGRGDRFPEDQWPAVTGPLDVVLIEGWCLAFRPVPEGDLRDPDLRAVNAALPDYDRWQRHVRVLMSWRAQTPELIVAWRVDAEERSRAAGRPGLDRAGAEDYIRRFLPVYAAYQDTVTRGPWGERRLMLTLDADRLPVA
jgi:D-glycerate 3-kinase